MLLPRQSFLMCQLFCVFIRNYINPLAGAVFVAAFKNNLRFNSSDIVNPRTPRHTLNQPAKSVLVSRLAYAIGKHKVCWLFVFALQHCLFDQLHCARADRNEAVTV